LLDVPSMLKGTKYKVPFVGWLYEG
jgi:hypothetical protein